MGKESRYPQEKLFAQSFWNIVDKRREKERKDFKILSEDHTAMANCPRQAQNREWQKYERDDLLNIFFVGEGG